MNRKKEYENGREKEGRENGECQLSHNRGTIKEEEDLSESNSEVKKPFPEKKKVCKPFDYHLYLIVAKLIITINA